MSTFEEISKSFLIPIVAPILAIIVLSFSCHSLALLDRKNDYKETGFIPSSANNVVLKSTGKAFDLVSNALPLIIGDEEQE